VPSLRERGVPVFRSPERALRAMAHATRYGVAATAGGTGGVAVPQVALDRRGTWPELAGKAVVAELGIAVPAGALARTLEGAQGVAARIGYPVALKAQSAELAHKSDAGGVILGIADTAALAAAWQRVHDNIAAARPGLALDGILVEASAPPGIEMVVGGRRDPDWGPVVMAGLGGIWIEKLHDVRLMAPGLARDAIVAEIGELKAAGLLRGARAQQAADIDALADAIGRIGAFLLAHPGVSEIDINPLVVYPKGVLALDVLLVTRDRE